MDKEKLLERYRNSSLEERDSQLYYQIINKAFWTFGIAEGLILILSMLGTESSWDVQTIFWITLFVKDYHTYKIFNDRSKIKWIIIEIIFGFISFVLFILTNFNIIEW